MTSRGYMGENKQRHNNIQYLSGIYFSLQHLFLIWFKSTIINYIYIYTYTNLLNLMTHQAPCGIVECFVLASSRGFFYFQTDGQTADEHRTLHMDGQTPSVKNNDHLFGRRGMVGQYIYIYIFILSNCISNLIHPAILNIVQEHCSMFLFSDWMYIVQTALWSVSQGYFIHLSYIIIIKHLLILYEGIERDEFDFDLNLMLCRFV